MKKNIIVYKKGKKVNKEINYIPVRYVFAILLTLLETLLILGMVVVLSIYIPYFYIAAVITNFVVIISIICSKANPDYKVPWLFFVMIVPVIGFMLYFLFYKRKLSKKQVKKITAINDSYSFDDSYNLNKLKNEDSHAYSQALTIKKIAKTHLFNDTIINYYPIGEFFFDAVIEELKKAKEFIFFEFFIVEHGVFFNSILEILLEKAKQGVNIKVIWDDIGCMSTLPGNYYKQLRKYGIEATVFSRLKGQADNEFNNRNHRKILVIDGKVGFTGGINIADEYINKVVRFGHWKDMGIKLKGNGVNELSKLFLVDFYSNYKSDNLDFEKYYVESNLYSNSYVIPFGDGPNPIYEENVGKTVIMNILNQAKNYVYISTPYLIIDSELTNAIKTTALRGVDVRIVVPHIPDKKLVFELTRANCEDLMKYGVKIYEYEPGFIHGKLYVSDDKFAMIGTINLDYRSLTHHFENGVWIYNDPEIIKMKNDLVDTLDKSIFVNELTVKNGVFKKFLRVILRILSPFL